MHNKQCTFFSFKTLKNVHTTLLFLGAILAISLQNDWLACVGNVWLPPIVMVVLAEPNLALSDYGCPRDYPLSEQMFPANIL